MTPKDGTEWRNRVAARSLLSFSWRRPVRRAAAIRCPILLVVAEQDTMAPVDPAVRVTQETLVAVCFAAFESGLTPPSCLPPE